MRLKEIISQQEKEIETKLATIRSRFTHAGIKGESFENSIRELLEIYLPKRLSVGTGQIIDSDSNITKQIDIVITTEYHPGIPDSHSPNLFFIEGVAAVGEVKTRLTNTELDSAIKNCNSFKNLNSKPVQSIYMGSESADTPSPYFIFAMESDLSIGTVAKKMAQLEPAGALESKVGPDLVFLKGKGIIIDPRGLKNIYVENDKGEKLTEWTILPLEESSLFDFVTLLISVIPFIQHMENFMRLYSNIKSKL